MPRNRIATLDKWSSPDELGNMRPEDLDRLASAGANFINRINRERDRRREQRIDDHQAQTPESES